MNLIDKVNHEVKRFKCINRMLERNAKDYQFYQKRYKYYTVNIKNHILFSMENDSMNYSECLLKDAIKYRNKTSRLLRIHEKYYRRYMFYTIYFPVLVSLWMVFHTISLMIFSV